MSIKKKKTCFSQIVSALLFIVNIIQ